MTCTGSAITPAKVVTTDAPSISARPVSAISTPEAASGKTRNQIPPAQSPSGNSCTARAWARSRATGAASDISPGVARP